MILAVANTKGGTGKTTTALQLALYLLTEKKRKVWLIDADDQKSSYTSIYIRNSSEIEPPLDCEVLTGSKELIAGINKNRKKYDDIIVDVGGRDTEALRTVMTLSDVLLIPTRPRSLDIWALQDFLEIIKEAKQNNFPFIPYVFIANADVQGTDNRDCEEILKTWEDVRFLNAPLCQRKPFATACSLGLCVTEMRPRDKKSIAELEKLTEMLFKGTKK